jgi:carbonic anhydrase/acetyltransferase-like protein (isoleucine patch superfamily)
MLLTHAGESPLVDATAYVAPNAVLSGKVTVGPGCRIMHGAQVIAEGGTIELGRECIVLQNAVLRSTSRHSLRVGDTCLIGPNSHVVGCVIEDQVFVATGASVFHGATLGRGCEVRINAVVHIKTTLADGATVPIGWVAVGTPAQILPPDQHDQIWEMQKGLNFPLTVYGIERAQADMVKITRAVAAALGGRGDDEPNAP